MIKVHHATGSTTDSNSINHRAMPQSSNKNSGTRESLSHAPPLFNGLSTADYWRSSTIEINMVTSPILTSLSPLTSAQIGHAEPPPFDST